MTVEEHLLECFQCSDEQEPELRKELNGRLNNICKPCWELKYCPYGPVVEDLPCGKIVKGLMEAGTVIGVSTRGAGSIKEDSGVDYVDDDYQIFAVDVCTSPSRNRLLGARRK